MSRFTRRRFLESAAGSAAALALRPAFALDLPVAGDIRPVRSADIEASPLSVGFEVLDRKCFDPTRTYAHLAALGAKSARCQTGWCRCETTKGEFDFAWLDAVVDSLLKIGVQPWFNLGYGNALYAQGADATAVGWAPVFDEPSRQAWARFVHAIGRHFAGRVRHWEIWNEPNISTFWKPRKPSASDYVDLVKLTAPILREHVKDAVLIGGAYAGIPMSYIKGCLDAGMAEHVDKLSYHPYRPVPESGYAAEISALRKLIAGYRKDLAIWQGENGCPSKGGKGSVGALSNLEWNETRQAKWLLRRILTDLRLDVEFTSYFHTIDLVGYRGATNFKGLLRGTEYTPKPSYYAYQRVCALFDSRTVHRPELTLDLVDQQKVHLQDAGFAREGRAIYAWWLPASLQKPFEAKTITIRVNVSAQERIDSPVLVDLMSGKYHAVEPKARDADSLTFANVPLLDYPLLLADRATVATGHT